MDYFTDKEKFNFNKNGFKIAFSVEQYLGDKLARDDPNYVRWDVHYKLANGTNITWIPLRIHKCTDLDYDSFYKPSKNFELNFAQAKKRKNHYCIDDDQDLEVYGLSENTDYNRLDMFYLPCNPDVNKQCNHTLAE